MTPKRNRLAALVVVSGLGLGVLAGCGDDSWFGGAEDNEASGADRGTSPSGVENYYGEYGDYATMVDAIDDGEITAEDLENPWVAQQGHVDAADDWDGTGPDYELTPPAGGDHLSTWQTCSGAVYTEPLVDGHAVHSLEHGAVWLTYDPELVDEAATADLASKIEGRDFSFMSPYPGQGVGVSLQSWGNRYQTDEVTDPVIDDYLDFYILNGDFNPEPNAPCSGGTTDTAA